MFPNFCLSLAIPLHDFLERADLRSGTDFFAVCTRGGTHSDAFDYIDLLLQRQGKRLAARTNITMPWNHPLGPEDLAASVAFQNDQLSLFSCERNYRLHRCMYERLVHFSGDAKCDGCGICARVCPGHKIKLVDGRPAWMDGRCGRTGQNASAFSPGLISASGSRSRFDRASR